MSRKGFDLSLYLVTDRRIAGERDLKEQVLKAVQGGCTMVQLREKDIDTRQFVEEARALMRALAGTGVPLIINDRIDVALAADADGVHIGQSDMPYEDARTLLGDEKIIGLSVENHQEVLEANALDVDYIGISPVFSTATKTDTATPFGLDGTRQAVLDSLHPCVAIGGMNRKTAGDVMAQGVDGIAVVSDIMASDEPENVARTLRQMVESSRSDWCSEVWQLIEPVRERIWRHPFLLQLADGSLPQEQFTAYLQQDRLYLQAYYERMFAIAEMLPDAHDKEMFRAFARISKEEEEGLHKMLLGANQLTETMLPMTKEYVEHERWATDTHVPAIALAAIFPCMWIYSAVGAHLQTIARVDEQHPYGEWIRCYADPMMAQGVEEVKRLLNPMADTASTLVKAMMRWAFCQASKMEYEFWDQITNKP